jgi:hypothetical protein
MKGKIFFILVSVSIFGLTLFPPTYSLKLKGGVHEHIWRFLFALAATEYAPRIDWSTLIAEYILAISASALLSSLIAIFIDKTRR